MTPWKRTITEKKTKCILKSWLTYVWQWLSRWGWCSVLLNLFQFLDRWLAQAQYNPKWITLTVYWEMCWFLNYIRPHKIIIIETNTLFYLTRSFFLHRHRTVLNAPTMGLSTTVSSACDVCLLTRDVSIFQGQDQVFVCAVCLYVSIIRFIN